MIPRFAVVAGLLAVGVATGGCIGSMALTAKVRDFNMQVSPDPWPREGVFLLLYFVPVYPFAGMADLLVVNSIEFWTGTNPVSHKSAAVTVAGTVDSHRESSPDGTVAESTLREDGSIDVEVTAPDGTTTFMN